MKQDILTPEEQARVIFFNQDEVLKTAIRKVMLADIYSKGIVGQSDTTNWAYNLVYSINPQGMLVDNGRDDASLGEVLRGTVMGLSMLETAFRALDKYKSEVQPEPEKKNEAL